MGKKTNYKGEDVYTTVYQNFAGVDLTNDPSNCWYRRSPDAVNMLPDDSGTPHKRFGWKIKISAATLADKYSLDTSNEKPDEVEINKMYYFSLAGLDHVFIFSNIGVFIYRKNYQFNGETEEVAVIEEIVTDTTLSYDEDVIDSYNRAYFFEANGEAAFYIYGNFRMWRYRHTDEGFAFEEIEAYVPTVNITLDAKHTSGASYESVNLLSKYIAEEFQDNVWLSVNNAGITTNRVDISATVPDETVFLSMITGQATYQFTYTANGWTLNGDSVNIMNYGVVVAGTLAVGDWIKVPVTEAKKIKIPRTFDSYTDLTVKASTVTQFDTTITVVTSTPRTNECKYTTDGTDTYLEFYSKFLPLVEGEDSIRVTFPRKAASITQYASAEDEIDVEARNE